MFLSLELTSTGEVGPNGPIDTSSLASFSDFLSRISGGAGDFFGSTFLTSCSTRIGYGDGVLLSWFYNWFSTVWISNFCVSLPKLDSDELMLL